jgi:hypothetical protein
MAQPLEYEQVGYNAPDGIQMGRTTSDLIAFYGTAPITRITTSSNVSTVTTISTAGNWGFASQVEIQNMISAVSTIHAALKSLGLVL